MEHKYGFISEYYSGIKSGKYIVGKWIHLLYEIILNWLDTKQVFFDERKACRAIPLH